MKTDKRIGSGQLSAYPLVSVAAGFGGGGAADENEQTDHGKGHPLIRWYPLLRALGR